MGRTNLKLTYCMSTLLQFLKTVKNKYKSEESEPADSVVSKENLDTSLAKKGARSRGLNGEAPRGGAPLLQHFKLILHCRVFVPRKLRLKIYVHICHKR